MAHRNHFSAQFSRAFLANAAALVCCFMLQRFFTWKKLGIETLPSELFQRRAAISGLLADTWSGIALAAIIALLSFALSKLLKRFSEINTIFLLIALVVLSLHIIYVEFFGGMVSLAHLSYLLDFHFVKSSYSSVYDGRVLLTAGASFTLYFLFRYLLPNRFPRTLGISVFLAGVGCQVLKVQLNTMKIGWKTPWLLSVTSFEAVVVQLQDPGGVALSDLTENEWHWLQKRAQKTVSQHNSESLSFVLEEFPKTATSELGLASKAIVQERIALNKPTFFIVALLEAVRPEDTRAFEPTNEKTFTPFLDSLAESSIQFNNAFTSGGVTRAGQEAVLCGLLAGEHTSAMRGLLSLNPTCLARIFKEKNAEGAWTGWWHGGDYNFDGQGSFWKRAGFDVLTSREGFSSDAPASFWGVSDFAVVQKMKEGLRTAPQKKTLQLHLFLSVTNHPDWALPYDSPQDFLKMRETEKHLSFASTRYTDAAMESLVTFLKNEKCDGCENSFWENTVLFVVNDHGSTVPSQKNPNGTAWDVSEEGNVAAAMSTSRAALIVSGGIIEQSLKDVGQPRHVEDKLVSQVDIFATIADFIGQPQVRTVGDSLFSESRRWPIVVDIGRRIFVPQSKVVQVRDEFLKPVGNVSEDDNLSNAKVFFRANQHLLLSGNAGK